MAALIRQILTFGSVGVVATLLHYIVLVALVELGGVPPVPAALCGAAVGAIVSYGLNRRHTFDSDRPHDEAGWRFAVVAGVAFLLTYLFMRQMVEIRHVPYLPAQGITTLLVMIWTFGANRMWTFREQL